MNYKAVLAVLGKVMLVEALLLCCPLIVGFIYQEGTFLSFLIPILGLVGIGAPLAFLKLKDSSMYAKEGFVIVGLAWIIMSLFGALPFTISGEIPNYVDAFFETVSGFTTTGASILTGSQIDNMSKSVMFWRLFTHWIGGMGILVFMLAIIPKHQSGNMHVFRSEAPGPSVGKLVSKLSFTARILYGIYLAITLLETLLLVCSGMSFYESLLMSFSTAGTGGFGVSSSSAIEYTSYQQIVISIFMFLFGVNFNFYYLILIGSFRKAFASEELRVYFIIVVLATITIALNIFFVMGNVFSSFGEALKHSFFQVTSISSTTGLVSFDFERWPTLSKSILLLLTIIGACGGSTGGGIKVARLIILGKSTASDFKRLIHPRSVVGNKFEGEPLDTQVRRNVKTYMILWFAVVILCVLLLSIDKFTMFENISATLACIGNVGPGFGVVGATGGYGGFSIFSKIILSFVMLVGRLEIFPMLLLFAPSTWKRG